MLSRTSFNDVNLLSISQSNKRIGVIVVLSMSVGSIIFIIIQIIIDVIRGIIKLKEILFLLLKPASN